MKDLLTGEEFEPMRIDQKFANAANRIKYYNLKAKKERIELSKLDKPLKINKRIIDELLGGKKEAEFNQQFLLGKGFDFRAYNRVQEHNNQNHFCIYQYIIVNDNKTGTTKFITDERY